MKVAIMMKVAKQWFRHRPRETDVSPTLTVWVTKLAAPEPLRTAKGGANWVMRAATVSSNTPILRDGRTHKLLTPRGGTRPLVSKTRAWQRREKISEAVTVRTTNKTRSGARRTGMPKMLI
jgi:hypothetical protein